MTYVRGISLLKLSVTQFAQAANLCKYEIYSNWKFLKRQDLFLPLFLYIIILGDNMNLKELIGKKRKVKIIGITNNKKYFVSEDISLTQKIYIEDTGDFELQELIGKQKECIIIDIINNNLIGFIISDRKFENDMKKIERKLIETGEIAEVEDIYLIERLKIKGKVLGLYMIDGKEQGKYYLGTVEIGTYVKKLMDNNIIFKNKKIEDEIGKQIRDVIISIDLTKKEISINEEKQKQIDIISTAIGIETGYEITKLATLDLKQRIQKKQNNERNINNIMMIQNKKQSTIKDVNIKQEMEMNDKVTDMKTLGQLLEENDKLPQIEGKKFIQMGVIESEQRDNLINTRGETAKVNTTRYSFVAIAKDGSVVPLELSQDHQKGTNPREENYQVDQKGEVSKDDVLSRFNIGRGTFAVKNGKYGEIKVYHSPRKTIGGKGQKGNQSLDRELETNNVWSMKKEERDLAGEYKTGYRSVEKGYQEAKAHEDEKGNIISGDEIKTKDIDGDVKTKTHIHDNVDYEELASKWGYYEQGKPDMQKAEKLFQEKRKEYPQKEQKEIIEMITDELEEEILHNRNQR